MSEKEIIEYFAPDLKFDEDGNRFRLCYSPEEIIHATTIYAQRNGCLGYWRKL